MERPHGACGLGDQLRAEGQGAGFSASDRCRQLRLVGTSRRAVGEGIRLCLDSYLSRLGGQRHR